MKMNSVRGRRGKTTFRQCRHSGGGGGGSNGGIVLPVGVQARPWRRMLMATVDLPCMNMTGNMTVILPGVSPCTKW